MADHTPHYFVTPAISMAATGTITGGRLVAASGSMTVATAGAAATTVVGVAGRDAVSGASLPVYTDGIHDLVAAGAITAGDAVAAGAAGTVATIGGGAFGTKIGKALETIADTATGRILLEL